jgi:ABC-2 type transport system permease protein
MIHTLRMYLRLTLYQVRSQMQHRASFLLDVLSTGLVNGIYFFTLALVLTRFDNIAGWSLPEIAFMAGMAEMSFASMDMILSGFDPDVFSVFIQQGRLDQLLLRPLGITFQVLGSSFFMRRFGRIFEGVVIFALALAWGDIHWTLGKLLYLPVVFLSQMITMGALFVMGCVMIFWTIQRVEAINIVTYGGVEMITYPMTIYPGWLRKIFTYAIPFIFINYYPALYFLDKPDPLGFPPFAPFIAPLVAALLFFIAMRLWRFGLNHYQSTGS